MTPQAQAATVLITTDYFPPELRQPCRTAVRGAARARLGGRPVRGLRRGRPSQAIPCVLPRRTRNPVPKSVQPIEIMNGHGILCRVKDVLRDLGESEEGSP